MILHIVGSKVSDYEPCKDRSVCVINEVEANSSYLFDSDQFLSASDRRLENPQDMGPVSFSILSLQKSVLKEYCRLGSRLRVSRVQRIDCESLPEVERDPGKKITTSLMMRLSPFVTFGSASHIGRAVLKNVSISDFTSSQL
jgi:hypothetical protein